MAKNKKDPNKIPTIINNPEKITDQENLAKQKINIKTIPLKIKPIKAPLSLKKEKQSDLRSKSTLKIVIVTCLLIINIILLINIINNKNNDNISYSNKIPEIKANVLGSWLTTNNSLFVFNDDYTFYWYESYKEQTNNYYAGTYSYKQGPEALKEMGYTEEEFKKTFGENLDINNAYSLNLLPSLVYKGYQDTTTRDLKDNETWWFILIKKDANTAIAYNKTLDQRYNLTLN